MAFPIDRLPRDILSIIFSLVSEDTPGIKSTTQRVPENSLARCASVSRQWQQYIERLTFRKLYVTPHRIASAVADNILTPQRLSYLRYIQVEFIVDRRMKRGRRKESGSVIDHIFEDTVESLFCLLEQAPLRPHPFVIVEFAMPVHSFESRIRGPVYGLPFTERHTQYPDFDYDKLPTLPMVVSFRMRLLSRVITIEPGKACLIAHKMPRLEAVDWEMYDGDRMDIHTRMWLRDGFARNLSKLPKSLKHLSVKYFRPLRGKDHADQPQSIVPTGSDGDTLSNALFHFTQQNALTGFYFNDGVKPSARLQES
ncbi:hypothetical protein BKA56DRAFT_677373 [Ilyonectria sp. MPI-CAGE-AT-0026]|nr:hypothetical protein BKA56DRAFT_677373 [Ilyonectria sp. MPI-CAGE-AT-0026]